jgi:hypothetical protein
MTVPAEILDATMRLPEPVRRELGRQLLESSDPSAQADPTEVEAAWNDEAGRRIAAYRRGETALLTEDDVRDLLDP